MLNEVSAAQVRLVECPRDAMQGLPFFVPTEVKVQYLNLLLQAGFHTLDFGSFVSPKVIPQMRDTAEVLAKLDLANTATHLLAVVASASGARLAMKHPEIQQVGYPLSISETFQLRNTNKGIAQSLDVVEEMQALCTAHGKTLVIYFSMAFGNPYNDPYNPDVLEEFAQKMDSLGVKIIALADTIGVSNAQSIGAAFGRLLPAFPHIEFGAHFHSHPRTALRKIEAAWQAGCRRFDSAMMGFGGCPMAKDELTGNIATEAMTAFFDRHQVATGLHAEAFAEALRYGQQVFYPN